MFISVSMISHLLVDRDYQPEKKFIDMLSNRFIERKAKSTSLQ
jgi:hypothetical protein